MPQSLRGIMLALVFVLIWSTAPIFTKLGLEYTTPFVFLTLRLAMASIFLIILCQWMRAPWPKGWKNIKHLFIVSLLIQVVYLGSSFRAMSLNTAPAIFAIVLGAQPLLTALVCRIIFKDAVTPIQWVGLVLGFIGLLTVTVNNVSGHLLSWGGLFFLLLALCGITFGTIYQKKKCSMIDYRTLAAGQNLMGLVPMFILAYTFEPFRVQWTWQFNFALFWMVVFISLIAFIILHILIQRGEVTRVASLFYMMPPCTAVMDYFVFGNKLDETTWVSLIIISIGIYLVNQQSPKRLLEAEEAQV